MRPILYEKTFYSDSGEKTLCICGFSDKSDKKDYAIYIDSDHVNETSICLSSEDLSELIVTLVSQRTLKSAYPCTDITEDIMNYLSRIKETILYEIQ